MVGNSGAPIRRPATRQCIPGRGRHSLPRAVSMPSRTSALFSFIQAPTRQDGKCRDPKTPSAGGHASSCRGRQPFARAMRITIEEAMPKQKSATTDQPDRASASPVKPDLFEFYESNGAARYNQRYGVGTQDEAAMYLDVLNRHKVLSNFGMWPCSDAGRRSDAFSIAAALAQYRVTHQGFSK